MCGVVPTLQCINRDDIRGGVAQDCLANLRKLLDLLGCEVVKNLVAHLSDVAGGDLLHLLLACGEQVADADSAVFGAEGAADVSALLKACHDAGETRR